MGLSKGSVIFVRVNKLEDIYARFSVHKQQIEHVHELKQQKCILTMCQENELKIWGFQDGKMAIWRKYNIQRPISNMKVLDDPTMLLFTFPSGESYFFRWSEKQKNLRILLPYELETRGPSNEHDDLETQSDASNHGKGIDVWRDGMQAI